MHRYSLAGVLAISLLCSIFAYGQVAPDVSPAELVTNLSSAGVSGGAYLTPAADVMRPPESRSAIRPGVSTEEVLSAFRYSHPQWDAEMANGVVNIMSPSLPKTFARVFDLTVEKVPITEAFQKILNKIDSRSSLGGIVGSVPRAGEVVRDELARFVVSLNLQNMRADEALNELVRQVPGAVWIAVHHEGRDESFDTIRLHLPNGIVVNHMPRVRLQAH